VMKSTTLMLWLTLAGLINAQSVYWKPDGGMLPLDQGSSIQLVFENCRPDGDLEIPQVDGLILTQRGTSQEVNIVNFDIQRSMIYSFMARPTREGKIQIPSFTVSTDKGEKEIKAVDFETRKTSRSVTLGPNGSNQRVTTGDDQEDLVLLRFTIEDGELWEGEVAQAEYVIKGWSRVFSGVQSSPRWNPDHLLRDGWNEDIQEFNEQVNGRNYIGGRYRADVMAEAPGTYDIDPVEQVVAWRTRGSTGIATFDRFFGGSRPTEMQSNPLRINVKALPDNAPDSFTGAVGDFQFSQEVVPAREVKVGEPITWTVQCHGRGNWPMGFQLPDRTFSKDFRVIQPKSKLDFEENTQFEGTMTEDMVLIPQKPGTYELGALEWSYFDPKAGQYRSVRTEPMTVTVVPGSIPVQTPAITPSGSPGGSVQPPVESDSATVPELSEEVLLPRGWRQGVMGFRAPWSWSVWMTTLLAPLPFLLLTWLLFSWRHAPRTDRHRNRRRAWNDLQTLLQEGFSPTDDKQLKQWRSLTCSLWEVSDAVPGRQAIETAAGAIGSDSQAEEWGRLWEEVEVQLYHPQSQVPADWMDRARAALSRARVGRPAWWHAFYPRNLFPGSLALVLLAFLVSPSSAEDAATAYRQGDYPQAETKLRQLVLDAPQDWAPRYNLALSLMQQQRWEEALAWTVSSWLQSPGQEDTTWNLKVASRSAEIKLSLPDPGSPPTWLSPRHWQTLALVSGWLGLIGLLALMLCAYRGPRRALVLGGIATGMVLCFIISALSIGMKSQYGLFADPAAAMLIRSAQVRSIPTEVSEQIILEAPAGLAGVIEKEFLGWRQVRFASGQSGWVRKSVLVPLYRAEP
jgi:hypothetical protein